jgi:hypothetical protein
MILLNLPKNTDHKPFNKKQHDTCVERESSKLIMMDRIGMNEFMFVFTFSTKKAWNNKFQFYENNFHPKS